MPLNLRMSKREKDINGNYIGNAIGFCHCKMHEGALNSELARKHKCIGKRCKHLEIYDVESWKPKLKYYRRLT